MMSLVGRYVRGGPVDMESFTKSPCLEHLHDGFSGIEKNGAGPY
jgi:hypothetical protein